jgi:hypothetical protein
MLPPNSRGTHHAALKGIPVVPVVRPSDLQDRKERNMSLIRRLGTLRTLSVTVGVM